MREIACWNIIIQKEQNSKFWRKLCLELKCCCITRALEDNTKQTHNLDSVEQGAYLQAVPTSNMCAKIHMLSALHFHIPFSCFTKNYPCIHVKNVKTRAIHIQFDHFPFHQRMHTCPSFLSCKKQLCFSSHLPLLILCTLKVAFQFLQVILQNISVYCQARWRYSKRNCHIISRIIDLNLLFKEFSDPSPFCNSEVYMDFWVRVDLSEDWYCPKNYFLPNI